MPWERESRSPARPTTPPPPPWRITSNPARSARWLGPMLRAMRVVVEDTATIADKSRQRSWCTPHPNQGNDRRPVPPPGQCQRRGCVLGDIDLVSRGVDGIPTACDHAALPTKLWSFWTSSVIFAGHPHDWPDSGGRISKNSAGYQHLTNLGTKPGQSDRGSVG